MTPLLPEHAALLERAGISQELAETHGVRSARDVDDIPEHARWCGSVPGIVFPWSPRPGTVVEQYRPDAAVVNGNDTPRKYLWPKGQPPMLNVPAATSPTTRPAAPILFVEGTKQTLAAATAALNLDLAVVGVAGCYGWLSDGDPIGDLNGIPWSGREVVVIFDGDVATNANVWCAAERLAAELELRGVTGVRFAKLPGDKAGFDDVIAARGGIAAGPTVLTALVQRAGKLPRRPKGAGGQYFGPDGLLAAKLVTAIRSRVELAVDPGDRLLAYDGGVFVDGRHAVTDTIAGLLGDMYRSMHARTAEELLRAELALSGRGVPEHPARAVVNLANGLLDPLTGTLGEHTADHVSLTQFPVIWNPTAKAPKFRTWLDEVTDGRGRDLLEAVAPVLDQRGHRQYKAVFLHGPTRSGKSTFVRIIEAIVGKQATSAVTLHDLASSRFAAADLYGKVLNAAVDLSAQHVEDLSVFKQLTGDDPVRAERKYGQPFVFHNKALFIFAANEIPTVSEVSGAFLARIRPYQFPNTYEGREDPTIEATMMTELEGILVQLVAALRRLDGRGGYVHDDRSRSALDDFARHSDRVRLFLYEATEPGDGFTARGDMFDAFERWCTANRRHILGRHRFYEHLETAGLRAVKVNGVRGFADVTVRLEADWGAVDDDRGQMGQLSPTPASREGSEEETVVKTECAKPALSAPGREMQEW